jgi:hypothetical protein
MGVSIVFHHVVNQPHTLSLHFASFPTWTPRLSLYGSIFYLHLRRIMNPSFHPHSVFPSANLPSFHLPHTETHQWGPHPSSVSQEILPSLGHAFHTGAPVSVFVHFSPKLFIIYCTNAFISSHFLLSSLLATCFILATRNPCHPWLEHYLSSTLAGIVHIFRVLHRSLTSTL